MRVLSKRVLNSDLGFNNFIKNEEVISLAIQAGDVYATKKTGAEYFRMLKMDNIECNHLVKQGEIIDVFCNDYTIDECFIDFSIKVEVKENIIFKTNIRYVQTNRKGEDVCIDILSNAKFLRISVCLYEDEINIIGKEGERFFGDEYEWQPLIDLETGQIKNWKTGDYGSVFSKVKDTGEYFY